MPEGEQPRPSSRLVQANGRAEPFRYLPEQDDYALDFDPRNVGIGLFEGDREQDAFNDNAALA